MNKSHLVDYVASNLGVTRSDATVYVECVLEGITSGLIEDGRVKITGFGAFTRRHREPRKGTNPLTGEPISIPASETCGFKASPALRERLQPSNSDERADSGHASSGRRGSNQPSSNQQSPNHGIAKPHGPGHAAGQIEHKQRSSARTPGR
ncbi:MAG: HU family DNA-binding protein [Phycisphaerales bacterium]|jgi:DNA-binding protein HU-beta